MRVCMSHGVRITCSNAYVHTHTHIYIYVCVCVCVYVYFLKCFYCETFRHKLYLKTTCIF